MTKHLPLRTKTTRPDYSKETVSLKEVSVSTNFSIPGLYTYLNKGTLKGYKAGNKWFIYKDSYEEFKHLLTVQTINGKRVGS